MVVKSRHISFINSGKIFAKILLNRLTAHLDIGLLPESQCVFRKGHRTISMFFTARQLQQKRKKQHCGMFLALIDPTQTFDTVSRDGPWKIMAEYGPNKFITIVQ